MCSRCDWQEHLEEIDEMLSDPDYDFAEDTLRGIYEWVEENEHITERQISAVSNIRSSVEDR